MNQKNENSLSMFLMELMNEGFQEVAKSLDEQSGRMDKLEKKIEELEKNQNNLIVSAIRGEIASGQKTKDVAKKYGFSSARISQIAPRRKYNNG